MQLNVLISVQMADDCHLIPDDSGNNTEHSEMKKISLERVGPNPKGVFEANDTTLPLPIRKDLVVYMKKDGSCVRRGYVAKVVKNKTTSDVIVKQLHSRGFGDTTRSIEEVLLVDRPFFVGDTVVRFENAHLGEGKERERWCKEGQIGRVINVKCLADVLLLPSKIAVVENVSLDNAQTVGMLHPTYPIIGTNFVVYKQSVGYVLDDVSELTLRYGISHTVIVRERSRSEDGAVIKRKDPEDLWKDYVKGEVVGLSVEDASGEYARWPDGMPADFGKEEGNFSLGVRAFQVEKVRTVSITVEWIIGNGAEPSKIYDQDISENVRLFKTRVNTRFNPVDRVLLKTNEQGKVICKKDYFKQLTKKYKSKFEKRDVVGSVDIASGSTQNTSMEQPAAKVAKLDVTFDSETETSQSWNGTDRESEDEEADDMEEESDDEDEQTIGLSEIQLQPSSTSLPLWFVGRTMWDSRLKRVLKDGNNSAKQLLEGEFSAEVLLTRTVVDVEWLDGSVSRDIPSCELSPKEVDIDQFHHMPGSIVSTKDADKEAQSIRFGIILATNGLERCCTVRWFTREDELSAEWVQGQDESLSLFDIMLHQTLKRGVLGMWAQQDNQGNLCDRAIQVVEDMKNGKQKFRLPDGTFKELWPNEVSWRVLPLHQLLIENIGGQDQDGHDNMDNALTGPTREEVPFDPVLERNNLMDCLLRLMTADLGDLDGVAVNRMRWFEAAFLLVRSHGEALLTEKMSWNNALLRDALEFAGYLHEYRHRRDPVRTWYLRREYISDTGLSDFLSEWIDDKFKEVKEEGKEDMVKFCYRVHVLTRKYPRWFNDMDDHVTHKLFITMWSFMDSRNNKKCELFGDEKPKTMNELEQILGEKVVEYHSRSAWEQMTRDDVMNMYEAAARAMARNELSPYHLTQSAMDLLIRPRFEYYEVRDYVPPYDTYHPAVDRMMAKTTTELMDYDVIRDKKPMNTWEAVCNGLDGELKDQYDQLISSAPHTLRIRVCGDTDATMSDCFIWYHVLSQVLRTPDQLLPKTISIYPGLMSEDVDDEHWAIMSWIILMQAGVLIGPFYEYFPDNRKEYNYDVIERAVAINPVWSQFRLQLAAMYDLTVQADSSDLSARVNTFERFFPIKDILAAIRHALSEGDAKKPVCVVMESEVKEYTSGEQSATVEQIKELKKWTGDTSTETTSQPKKFEICSGYPRLHHFCDNRTTMRCDTGRAFHAALRKEHRLLRDHLPEGIYVRSYEDQTDLFSFLIIGPTGTPYEGVPFFFDVRLPPDTYPEKPPQVVYIPYSAEQLNPNLYTCGKVCTSLLGTWSGEGVETWNPKGSNLFQVILSIQALILVREPYFNEAGYESRKDLPESGPNSKRYNETAAVNALEYLWKVIKEPPPPFEDIIKQHVVSIWPDLREKLLRLSKDENSMPDYPVIGSKGFRLAIEKAVHRIDGCVEYNYDLKVGTNTDDYDIWGEGDEMDLRDEEEEDEKVWPPTDRICDRENEDDVFNRAGGIVDFLSGNDKYSHRLTYEYTEPVTCFLLRKQ